MSIIYHRLTLILDTHAPDPGSFSEIRLKTLFGVGLFTNQNFCALYSRRTTSSAVVSTDFVRSDSISILDRPIHETDYLLEIQLHVVLCADFRPPARDISAVLFVYLSLSHQADRWRFANFYVK